MAHRRPTFNVACAVDCASRPVPVAFAQFHFRADTTSDG
jgi:hypothetical protein